MGFGLHLTDLGAVIFCLMDQVGFVESGIDIADFVIDMALDIAGTVIVQVDRPLGHGVRRREIGRQFLVLDPDQVAGRLGDFDTVGGDGGNRFALVAHPVEGDRQLGARHRQNPVALIGLGAGDDGMNAGQCLCGRNIDGQDTCMGDIGTFDTAGQRVMVVKIGGILRAAGNLFGPVDHRHGHADGFYRRRRQTVSVHHAASRLDLGPALISSTAN